MNEPTKRQQAIIDLLKSDHRYSVLLPTLGKPIPRIVHKQMGFIRNIAPVDFVFVLRYAEENGGQTGV